MEEFSIERIPVHNAEFINGGIKTLTNEVACLGSYSESAKPWKQGLLTS